MSAKTIDNEMDIKYDDVLLKITVWSGQGCSVSEEKYSNEVVSCSILLKIIAFLDLSPVDLTGKEKTCTESSI